MKDNSVIIELGEVREIPRHVHNDYEIFYLLKGAVELDFDGVVYHMQQNDVILCGPGEVHGAFCSEPNILFRVIITEEYILRETGESQCRFLCNSCSDPLSAQKHSYEQLRRNLNRLMLAYYAKGQLRSLEVKTALLQTLSYLFEQFLDPRSGTAAPGQDAHMQPVIQYIHQNFRDDISLQAIADRQHTSIYHLSRQFKKRTGTGFTEYLNQVRLAAAVSDLLHSRESVMKIALNNGFSNVASFNRLFQKTYGDTPAKYRAIRHVGRSGASIYGELAAAFPGEEDLIKYLRQYDTKHQKKRGERYDVRIDATGSVVADFRTPQKIIQIGRVCELLKAEIRDQLGFLREKTVVDYVHFACIYSDGMYPYHSPVYSHYEYFQAFDYLYSASLKPFLQINLQDLPGAPAETASHKITEFLAVALKRYHTDFLAGWRFEIAYPPEMDPEALWSGYHLLFRAIRLVLPSAEIGLQLDDRVMESPPRANNLLAFLRQGELAGALPAFLTCYVQRADYQRDMDSSDYLHYRNYNTARIQKLALYLRQQGAAELGLVLMEWNTLSGYTTAESNVFYRSALFLDEIIHIRGSVCAVAFWLNTYVCEAATGRDHFDTLALFLIQQLKRPIYFALTLLDHLGQAVIGQDDYFVATRDRHDNLAILIMNPCYFSPTYALDKSFTDSVRRMFTVVVENIQGHFIIERYHMDMRQTALYDRWASMGFPSIVDRQVMEQLNKIVNIDYSIYEENIAQQYKLSATLEFNEATIIHIRRHI